MEPGPSNEYLQLRAKSGFTGGMVASAGSVTMRGFEIILLVAAVLFFTCTLPVYAAASPDPNPPQQIPGISGDTGLSPPDSGRQEWQESNLSPTSLLLIPSPSFPFRDPDIPIANGTLHGGYGKPYVIDEQTIAASPYIAHPWSAGEHHLFTMETWAAVAESASPSSVISGYGEYVVPVKIEDAWDRTIEVPSVQSYGLEVGRKRT